MRPPIEFEYNPPPLFKQGASARAKLISFALIAVILLVVDARFRTLNIVRQSLATALYPIESIALAPRDVIRKVGDYFTALSSLQKENQQLKRDALINSVTLLQSQQLLVENNQLRQLLNTQKRIATPSLIAEILYDARDPFTRKIILDRGSRQGVAPGQPVIDNLGVVGQVTRVFPFTSEVTLLSDKAQAIPVQVVRNGLRSIAYGRGQIGYLELRFMPANADIQHGDLLVTSGIDGIYPSGLAVAKVAQVEKKSNDVFDRIICAPTANLDRHKHLLILLIDTKLPPYPISTDQPPTRASIK